ncbi:MAG: cytochrome C [Saprospiraceae bacterium]|nr:cytochrome C [Saprospiraceae bacterium]
MPKFHLKAFVLLFLCCFMGCQQADMGTEMELTLYRRSVLDQIPRMLTLRFGDEHWLAYDLDHMNPVKLWHGGVLWNGAVFNSVKTVQPTSYGDIYKSFEKENYWSVKHGEHNLQVNVQFDSYALADKNIHFKYSISSDQGKIEVTESPVLYQRGDSILWQRSYRVSGLQGNMQLLAAGHPISNNTDITHSYAITPFPKRPEEITSGNGAQYWLDKSGCSTCHTALEKMIGPSYVEIANRYAQIKEALPLLVSRVQQGSKGEWGDAEMIPHPNLDVRDLTNMIKYILSLHDGQAARPRVVKKEADVRTHTKPGFGEALTGVHPAYELIEIRPNNFRPRVGGMAFHPDGSLLISTWDSVGSVYRLSGLENDRPELVEIKRIASGLAEPLGLTTVGEEIYVLQKHELTKLIDHDQDQITDEYVCINNQFGVTTDFHEFSYGLVFKDNRFYGGLGLAMRLMSSEQQLEDRGTVFSVSNQSDFQIIARGFRQTNGIGLGAGGEIFVTENQGQWVPGCKFIHVREGAFYGCQHGTQDRYVDQPVTPPAVWLPQDEIGNSPGEPIVIRDGPYAGQMIHGDVTHGGIKRVFLEKRNNEYQGCVFRFSQGLEAGINRLVYGSDGALYAGGVGMNGGWSHNERQFGLQKLKYNGTVPFEMLSISSLKDGFEIAFTHPIEEENGFDENRIKVQQWYYEATPAYGGPKLGLEDLMVRELIVSDDQSRVILKIDGLREGYIVHFLLDDSIKDQSGRDLWSGEAWYTLNNL